MKNWKKITAALSLGMIIALTACGETAAAKSPAQQGASALKALIEAHPDKQGFHEELMHWGFEMTPGEKFEWSQDMSANQADFAMVILAEPLLDAGLDIAKLDPETWIYEAAGNDAMGMELPARLILPYNVGDSKMPAKDAQDSLDTLLEAAPGNLMYHEDMNHYVLLLNGGNEVIWTEALGTNDADMAFVLEAAPLVEAGLDLDQLEGTGWTFKPADPKTRTPDQIIKTYDLKK